MYSQSHKIPYETHYKLNATSTNNVTAAGGFVTALKVMYTTRHLANVGDHAFIKSGMIV
jgi:hypothetical protein